ncbi:hypothetical protein LXA43DRAFT_922037 [Ganoderma leucocontextum]|nr:hypothetical protein LXA43DRAFT_922037 [Ganoderma leucocontextum]
MQHWDDPGNQRMLVNYDDAEMSAVAAEGDEYYDEEEESMKLLDGEIWDDSALIDAWNSAAAEYEAFHGPGKKWKQEPVRKCPLWYNIPSEEASKGKSKAQFSQTNVNGTNGVANSTPINFDTFVPTHDPSLAAATVATSAEPTSSAPAIRAEAAMASQDEAFSGAMTAMYWSRY